MNTRLGDKPEVTPEMKREARAWAEARGHMIVERPTALECIKCETISVVRDGPIPLKAALGEDRRCGLARAHAHRGPRRSRADRNYMPTRATIAFEQSSFLELIGFVCDPLRDCWACHIDCFDGTDQILQDRAHIIAHYLGGPPDPYNFFLLCSQCHKEQPDFTTYDLACFWLVSHERADERVARHVAQANRACARLGIDATDVLRMVRADGGRR
jgi:hypothetical protein